jgi:sterol 3beta-glucosyltransferase
MKISILTAGTRGDVEPCVALALGLLRAGHDVTVGADTNFRPFVTARGVGFVPVRADFQAFFASAEGQALMANNRPRLRLLRGLPESVLAVRQHMMEDAWQAVRDAEAVIYHPRVLGAYDAVEKRGVPAVLLEFLPLLAPTRQFPLPMVPYLRLGGLVNRLSYAAVRLAPVPYARIRNRWRARGLGLPPRPWYADDLTRRGRPLPVLYAFSPHVVPPPPEWRGRAEVTGYWFLDPPADWRPPPALTEFLAAGRPPLFVGFGSMVSPQPERVTAQIVAALKQAGQRAILASGWGGLAKVHEPPTLFQLDAVPHGWLFPRVAAVAHHGGMGTTAAGLRAGKPTLICPFFHDQPFWGKRIFDLGVGPRPIPQNRLSVDRLAEAFRALAADEGMRRRAAELGEKIRAEDGVGRAVAWVEAFLAKHVKAGSAPGPRGPQAVGGILPFARSGATWVG